MANSIRDLTYRIRVSAQAHRARLVISPSKGLEVVIPRDYDLRCVPVLVAIREKLANSPL